MKRASAPRDWVLHWFRPRETNLHLCAALMIMSQRCIKPAKLVATRMDLVSLSKLSQPSVARGIRSTSRRPPKMSRRLRMFSLWSLISPASNSSSNTPRIVHPRVARQVRPLMLPRTYSQLWALKTKSWCYRRDSLSCKLARFMRLAKVQKLSEATTIRRNQKRRNYMKAGSFRQQHRNW